MSVFGTPSPHEFARLVIETLRQEGETRTIRYDRERFRLVIGEESSRHVRPLSLLYDEFCVTPWWRRREVLSRESFSALQFLKPPARIVNPE